MVLNESLSVHKAFLTSAMFARKFDPTIYPDVLPLWDAWISAKVASQTVAPRQPQIGSSLTHNDPSLRANIPGATSHEFDPALNEDGSLPVELLNISGDRGGGGDSSAGGIINTGGAGGAVTTTTSSSSSSSDNSAANNAARMTVVGGLSASSPHAAHAARTGVGEAAAAAGGVAHWRSDAVAAAAAANSRPHAMHSHHNHDDAGGDGHDHAHEEMHGLVPGLILLWVVALLFLAAVCICRFAARDLEIVRRFGSLRLRVAALMGGGVKPKPEDLQR